MRRWGKIRKKKEKYGSYWSHHCGQWVLDPTRTSWEPLPTWEIGHWSVYPPDSLPHWLTVIPVGSNSTTGSPTQRFPRQQFWRGLHRTGVRCCPHEVSLSMHRSAISCSWSQRRTKGSWPWTPAASAILATEFSQLLCKGLRGAGSISFSLVSVAAGGRVQEMKSV